MKYTPFSITSKDGLTIQSRAWLSQKVNCKGLIFLLHDIGEHSARYAHIGEAFSEAGYHFLGFDLRGHGLSEGKRGHSPKFINLMDDIEEWIRQSIEHFGFTANKRILYGQGFGGNLVLNYLLRRKPNISGAIVTSPILNTPQTKSKIKVGVLKFLSNVFPGLSLRNPIKSKNLSKDMAFVKAYQDDVYNHRKISARLSFDLLSSGKFALENAHKLDIPILLMHGTSDMITPPTITKSLGERIGKMAEVVLWENFFHELHNDINREFVIDKILNWLKKEFN